MANYNRITIFGFNKVNFGVDFKLFLFFGYPSRNSSVAELNFNLVLLFQEL